MLGGYQGTGDWRRFFLWLFACLLSLGLAGCLTINSPRAGEVVLGVVTITATESDTSQSFQNDTVSFYVDNVFVGSDTATPYSVSWETRSFPDGVHTLVAKAYSLTQQKQVASSAVQIYVRNSPTGDTIPPTGSIQINTGAAYTASPAVTLTLQATDNSGIVAQMRFSNDNVTYSAPELYATTKKWALATGDGPKTVYVQFKDAASVTGNWSALVSGSIMLDTTKPSGQITSPQDGAVIGD